MSRDSRLDALERRVGSPEAPRAAVVMFTGTPPAIEPERAAWFAARCPAGAPVVAFMPENGRDDR